MVKTKKAGHVLAFTLAVMGILFVLITAGLELLHAESFSARQSHRFRQATNLAESGLEHAIRQLNASSSYPGESDRALGDGTFSVTVTGTGQTRTIEATGYIPNSTNPIIKRTIKAEASLDSDSVEFFYGIQVDGGGITMSNNSRVNGNVYSNGNIIGGPGSTITGDATVAGGLNDTPSVEWTANSTDQFFATSTTNRDIAQSFTANSSDNLNKISLYLAKVGNPTSNLSVRIATDNGNKPSTSSLATAVIPYASVGSSASWIDVTFSSAASVTNGTKYWIVLDYGSNSTANHWNWRKDDSDNYANNTGKYTSNCCSGSPVWADVGGDLAFKVWLGGTVTKIDGITVGTSTSGTARANQFLNTTVHGSSCPNQYCIIENPTPEVLPLSDGVIEDWKNDALAGGTHSGDYSLTNGQTGSLGPKKVQGNLTIDNGGQLTLTGTIWVTGDILISNGALVQLAAGYGSNSGSILTDGTVVVSNNAVFQGAGTGSYVLLLTTRDAKNSVSVTVNNNSVGVIYYAAKSRIFFSNNASAKEATAWGIDLSNNAVITYDSGLANAFFSSGPGGGWKFKKGSWRQVN